MITVTLPWPAKALSPNARVHRMVVAGAKKDYRATCGWLTRAAMIGNPGDAMVAPVIIAITFCPPDRRGRDLDNMLASIKSGLDGVADAMGVDDKHWSITLRRGEPIANGAVMIDATRDQGDKYTTERRLEK